MLHSIDSNNSKYIINGSNFKYFTVDCMVRVPYSNSNKFIINGTNFKYFTVDCDGGPMAIPCDGRE